MKDMPEKTGKIMKKLMIVLGVLGASFSAIFVRYSDAPSLVLVLYRMMFTTALTLIPVLLKHRRELQKISRRELLLCLLNGVLLGAHFATYFESLRYTSIASSVVLVNTEVFFVALGMYVFARERISARGWIGIVITFAGSVLVAFDGMGGGLKGDLLALCSAVCMASCTVIGRFNRRTLSTPVYTLLVYAVCGLTMLPLILLNSTPLTGYSAVNLWAALGLAVVCTLMGHTVFSWGLKYESASFVAMAKLLEPVFASCLGVLLFREIPGITVALGGLVILLGIGWYLWWERAKPPMEDAARQDGERDITPAE